MMLGHTDMFLKLHHQSKRRDGMTDEQFKQEENRKKDASKFDDAVGGRLHRIFATHDMRD